ncbi:rab11 family-interacting protein 5-like, partial [Malurus melanocephalus]|uniref:rab11 family-interacting protein 5-like n=1 Tax=Malurus melanocephalus TaxID=175006 RepID=UPI002547D63B
KEVLSSPKLTHKRAFSDDVSQVSPVLEPRAVQSLKPKNEPTSRSSLCINGSHVYGDDVLRSPVPPSSAPLPVPRRQEEPFGFAPLHPEPHEVPWALGSLDRAQHRDEPRFIPSPPSLALQEELKVSTKAVTLSNHLGRARLEEGRGGAEPAEDGRKEDRKAKGGFFQHGSKGDRATPVHTAATGDDRSKSSAWFGSKEPKESPQKPRSVQAQVQSADSCPKFPSPAALLVRAPRHSQ